MTDAKISEVLDLYELTIINRSDLAHIGTMILRMREMLSTGYALNNREKLMRGLGFIQGVFWAKGVYTIDELRSHNMLDGEEFRPCCSICDMTQKVGEHNEEGMAGST